MSIRIATSSRNSMRALTYQSVAAVDRYALIASFLSRHRDIFQKYGVTDPLSFFWVSSVRQALRASAKA